MIGTDIPNWDKARPHLSEYHKKIAKQAQQVLRFLDARKQMKLIKNLFLTTTIGSFLATQIANITNAEKMAWFSDRDEINDIADHFSATIFI
ncbi:MAG: hypothetical protein IPP29_17015 [Bacteroidetes bacterium]|nr:hypothetical protein [Bacteroidota bacterium]